jgi:hypothetical protein
MYIKPYLIEKNTNGDIVSLTTKKVFDIDDHKAIFMVDNEPVEISSWRSPQWLFTKGILLYLGIKNEPLPDEEISMTIEAARMKFGKHVNGIGHYSEYPHRFNDDMKIDITLGELFDDMIKWYADNNPGVQLVRPIESMSKYIEPNRFDARHIVNVKSFSEYFTAGHPYFIKWGTHPKAAKMGDNCGRGSYCMCIRANSGGLTFTYAAATYVGNYVTEYADVYVKDVYTYGMEFYECYNHIQLLDLVDLIKANPSKYKGKKDYDWPDKENESFVHYITLHDDDDCDEESEDTFDVSD